MARPTVRNPKNTHIRIEPSDKMHIKSLRKKMVVKSDGDVIHRLLGMYKEKKIGKPAFLEESQHPKLIEGATENDAIIYKSLYEDALKINTNYVKRVNLLAQRLGISYSEAMKLEIDATIQT